MCVNTVASGTGDAGLGGFIVVVEAATTPSIVLEMVTRDKNEEVVVEGSLIVVGVLAEAADEVGVMAAVEVLDELPIQPLYFQQRQLMARLSKLMEGSERLA